MAKRSALSAVEFVRVYGPMAKQGKSALEIGQALGFTGDAKKVAIAVSVKASQLRKRLINAAKSKAAAEGLSDEDANMLVATMANKLPKIRGGERGRKSDVTAIVSALDEVLAAIDKESATVEIESEAVEIESEAVETESKPRKRRSLLGG
jgi:hypothetical protein